MASAIISSLKARLPKIFTAPNLRSARRSASSLACLSAGMDRDRITIRDKGELFARASILRRSCGVRSR